LKGDCRERAKQLNRRAATPIRRAGDLGGVEEDHFHWDVGGSRSASTGTWSRGIGRARATKVYADLDGIPGSRSFRLWNIDDIPGDSR